MTTKKSNNNGNDFEKIDCKLDNKTHLMAELATIKRTSKLLVCKILHAQILQTTRSTDGRQEIDVTHHYSPLFIENATHSELQKKYDQKIIIAPQKTGELTDIIRIIVDTKGYHMDIVNHPKHKFLIGSFQEVSDSQNLLDNLRSYRRRGARFIYQDGAHPNNDPF
jgi:hypothetical protein